ncbi:MAG: hypothetical protein ACRDP6_06815, partial [Actinoallomurus sp.]
MLPDQTYLNVGKLAPARYLQRAGQWDIALESIAEVRTDTATALRAEILVDRHAWRLDPPGEALEAVERLRATDESLAVLLAGQLAYWQRVFDLGGDSILPDVRTAFAEAAHDKRFHGWAVFFGSVCCQYLVQDEGEAAEGFANALAIAHDGQDLLLESYALRHQGELRQESDRDGAVDLLRRSLA